MCTKIYLCWDISGSLVIKTLHLHCRDTGSIPSQRIKISYATWARSKKKEKEKKDVYVQRVTDTLVNLEKDWKTGKHLIMYQ